MPKDIMMNTDDNGGNSMMKIIFCLVLTVVFSFVVLGQRSVRSNSRRQPTPQQSWKTFFHKFKAAVAERDEVALKGMMLETMYCESIFEEPAWKFCESNASRIDDNRIASNLIFDLLGKNNNRGWIQFKNFVDNGKEVRGTASTYKGIALKSNPECDDLAILFQYENKRWFFIGFGNAGSCRD